MAKFRTTREEAKRLYEDLARHTTVVGAYNFASEEDERRLRLWDRQTEIAADCKVTAEPKNDHASGDHPPQILIEVPSVWHAVIHMLVNNRSSWMTGEVALNRRMSLIYRGQRDCRWQLEPSLARPGIDVEKEQAKQLAFSDLLRRLLDSESQFNWLLGLSSIDTFVGKDTPDFISIAAAQHYGIRTDLLDFTTDPAVAAWFACSGSKGKGEETASLFGLPMELAAHNGVGLILPHPFVERVYNQHGVFSYYAGGASLRGVCVEVRFPPTPDFQVLRDNAVVMEALPADRWWMSLVRVAEEVVENDRLDDLLATEKHPLGVNLIDLDLPSGIDFIGLPEFAARDQKVRLLRNSIAQLTNTLLHLTVQLDGQTPRVMKSGVRMCIQFGGFTLRGVLPLLRERIESMSSDNWLPSIVEPMLDAFEEGLRGRL